MCTTDEGKRRREGGREGGRVGGKKGRSLGGCKMDAGESALKGYGDRFKRDTHKNRRETAHVRQRTLQRGRSSNCYHNMKTSLLPFRYKGACTLPKPTPDQHQQAPGQDAKPVGVGWSVIRELCGLLL